jgi:hypothetical protein
MIYRCHGREDRCAGVRAVRADGGRNTGYRGIRSLTLLANL